MNGQTIYLDHAATTAVSPEVLRAMEPYFSSEFGNPSSMYSIGQAARQAIDTARSRCAAVLGCRDSEVVFTSGGTESDNAALLGVPLAQVAQGRHVVTTAIEHHAVLHAGDLLKELGFEVDFIRPQRDGIIDPESIGQALRPDTSLVSVILANNETGVIQPIADIADVVRKMGESFGRKISMHTDAVQAPGSIPVKVDELGVDLLSLSAHKFNGPKGVGILYLRRNTPFRPTQLGGGQERERRAGTENVAAIVGMSIALELAESRRETAASHLESLSKRLLAGILERVEGVHVNGSTDARLPGTVNVSLDKVESETLLMALDLAGIAASSGSACTAGSIEPSHVLLAMGLPDSVARSSLRLTLGPENTEQEIDHVVDVLATSVPKIRSLLK